MHLQIRGSGISIRQELREYVERRLCFALSRFADVITHVAVTLRDMNGPDKGGIDMQCAVEIRMAGIGRVFATADDALLSEAVDRASERAGHNVLRALKKKRKRMGGWLECLRLDS